jgi:hypothetical protein
VEIGKECGQSDLRKLALSCKLKGDSEDRGDRWPVHLWVFIISKYQETSGNPTSDLSTHSKLGHQ